MFTANKEAHSKKEEKMRSSWFREEKFSSSMISELRSAESKKRAEQRAKAQSQPPDVDQHEEKEVGHHVEGGCGPMPLKLTKAEQKKMRRRARAEKQREQQERVLLGLDPAPKNRMKISNMMKVLTTEAVQDPTQIEKMVRAEMEERAKAHDARNQERKLTPEQARLKKLKKLKEDTSLITHVALFRVTNLSDERHKCVDPPYACVCGQARVE